MHEYDAKTSATDILDRVDELLKALKAFEAVKKELLEAKDIFLKMTAKKELNTTIEKLEMKISNAKSPQRTSLNNLLRLQLRTQITDFLSGQ